MANIAHLCVKDQTGSHLGVLYKMLLAVFMAGLGFIHFMLYAPIQLKFAAHRLGLGEAFDSVQAWLLHYLDTPYGT